MENYKEENQIQIELSEEVAQGTYTNLAIISFFFRICYRFCRIVPGVPKAKVKSRIILTPENAKRLLLALKDNIDKFEKTNGTIHLGNEPENFFPPLGKMGSIIYRKFNLEVQLSRKILSKFLNKTIIIQVKVYFATE